MITFEAVDHFSHFSDSSLCDVFVLLVLVLDALGSICVIEG